MLERDWQTDVLKLAALYGWQAMHVRTTRGKGGRHTTSTSVVGWPDLTLWRDDRLIFAELKSDTGKTTPEQEAVLASLRLIPCAHVAVWRPADIDAVVAALSARHTPIPRSYPRKANPCPKP